MDETLEVQSLEGSMHVQDVGAVARSWIQQPNSDSSELMCLIYALEVNTADGWSGWHQGPEENDVEFTVRKSVVDHMVFE